MGVRYATSPVKEAQDFYEGMIKDLVVDIPVGDGQFKPLLNFTELVARTRRSPQAVQIAIQLLAQANPANDLEKRQGDLHGTWMMSALLEAFGPDNDAVRFTRMIAVEYYEAAVK